MTRRTYEPNSDIGKFLNSMIELGGDGSMRSLSDESGISMQGLRNWLKDESGPSSTSKHVLETIFG